MYRSILLLVISGFFINTYADSAVQTDWSGGSWTWDPTGEWGNQFYLETNIEWDSGPGVISLHYNAEHIVDGDFGGASSAYSTDIDGDGDMDVLGAAYQAHHITWWENIDGSGTSWIEHTIDESFDGANSAYSEDIDGDGDMDVLGTAYHSSDIAWWENIDGSGTSWIKHFIDEDFYCAYRVYSEDIDGDDDMDVLGVNIWGNEITWWENINGSGTSWAEHIVDGSFYGARSVYSDDIDGDGYMDILGAAYSNDDITWWENIDGSGTSWIKHIVDGDFNGANSAYSEDIDGDGDIDILGSASPAYEISWWENLDGTGTSWTEHIVDGDFKGVNYVYSEDLDDDGDMDVLGSAGWPDHYISWWENINGSGTSWTKHIVVELFYGVKCIYPEDINGDGNMDVLGAAGHFGEITWWDLGEYSSDGYIESSCLYLHNDPGWGSIDWTAEEPVGTSVAFQVRSCDSPNIADMGVWSDTLYSPCSLMGILNEYDSFFQYKVILLTSDSSITPVLEDITVTWDPLGVGDDPQVTEYLLFGAEPNPSSSSVSIGFAIPELSQVELSIYDLTGRLVIAPSQGEYSPGVQQVQLGELTPGIYFCRMISGDFAATQRFVVIK